MLESATVLHVITIEVDIFFHKKTLVFSIRRTRIENVLKA